MTWLEVGDRVKYNGVATHEPWTTRKREGTPGVVEELPPYEGGSYAVRFEDPNGVGYVGSSEPNALVKLSGPEHRTTDLIGRAPEPVKAPTYTGPFRADGDRVVDSANRRIGYADGTVSNYVDDERIANVLAQALNVYFGYEEEK